MRKSQVFLFLLTFVSMLAFTLLPAAATDSDAAPIPTADEQYHMLLMHYADGMPNFTDTNIDYPDWYGGAYMSGKNLIINVTELTNDVRNELTSITNNPELIIQEVKFSFETLLAALNRVNEAIIQSEKINLGHNAKVVGAGLSVNGNAVKIYVSGLEAEKTASMEEVFPDTSGTPLASVRIQIVRGSEAIAADADRPADSSSATVPALRQPLLITFCVLGCICLIAVIILAIRKARANSKTPK